MYLGYKTDGYLGTKPRFTSSTIFSFTYITYFCFRRFAIVFSFFHFMSGGQNSSGMLFVLIFIESVFFIYLIKNKPHVEKDFNSLEIVEIGLMIIILYSMHGYTTTSILTPEVQWSLGFVSVVMILLIAVLHVSMLIFKTT